MDPTKVFIIIGIIAWAIQITMTFFQIRSFNHMLQTMADKGVIKMGKTSSYWKARTIVVLVESEDKVILDAKSLSGWTVFARPKILKEVIGDKYPFKRKKVQGLNDGIQEALNIAFQSK